MQTVLRFFGVLVAAVTAIATFRSIKRHAGGSLGVAPTLFLDPGATLVKNIEKIHAGLTKTDVARLLGTAKTEEKAQWFYNLDQHSGYLVKFDPAERVQSVLSWKS